MRYSQLLKFITPHRDTLAGIVLILLAGTGFSLLHPLMAGVLTDSILNGPEASGFTIPTILLLWLVLMAANAGVIAGSQYLIGSTGAKMSAELRSRVYEHMQVLPLSWFQERKQGDILSLLSSDAALISGFVTNTLVQLLPLALTFLTAILIMAWLDPLIAFLAVLMLPLYYLVMKLLGRRLRPLSQDWVQSRSDMIALANENLGLIPVIKSFTREKLEASRFRQHNSDLLNISIRQIRVSSLLSPSVGLLAGAGALLLLWIGIRHIESGQLTPPELVTLLLYTMLLMRPLASLANVYGNVMTTRGAAERLLEFFAEQPEPSDTGTRKLGSIQGHIEFDKVTFAYPERPQVLERFSLDVQPGETIALTGPNGAGKSTLVHLLMRFMEPTDGSIRIDGTDISDISLQDLRGTIGLVSQNTLLLNGSVAANIAYGCADAELSEIKKAAIAARVNDFAEALPEGYDTIIGDQGVKLSGGQRQRLSLARALLKNPQILILDEATAMFDLKGEVEFIEICGELFSQRTVILISHRPASLALADRIIEMKLYSGSSEHRFNR